MNVELDRYNGGKYLCDKVAAKLPGVQFTLAKTATIIGGIAQSILDAHHGQTVLRLHNLPPPRVVVERKHDQPYGSVDYYVSLEAEDPKNGLGRAIAIEFGHEYETYEQNPSGPWNRSGGIRALGRAVDVVSYFGID